MGPHNQCDQTEGGSAGSALHVSSSLAVNSRNTFLHESQGEILPLFLSLSSRGPREPSPTSARGKYEVVELYVSVCLHVQCVCVCLSVCLLVSFAVQTQLINVLE